MIAVNDAVDVLRHGWQDAASTFAPGSPEIAELLQARLEMVVAGGAIDESHLLSAIEDVESMATSAGSASGQALARRLHRTVYEYLLALDATPAIVPEPDREPDLAVVEAPVEPAEAPAEAETQAAEGDVPVSAGNDADPPASAATPETSVAQDPEATPIRPADASAADAADVIETGRPTPKWRYTAHAEPSPDGIAVFDPVPAAAPGPSPQHAPVADVEPLEEASQPAEELSTSDPGDTVALESVQRPPAVTETAREATVAPKAGFHIVESTHPSNVPGDDDSSPLQMPAFAADQAAASSTPEFTTSRPRVAPAVEAAPAPSTASAHAVDPEAGWRVRGLPAKTADGSAGARTTSEPDMEEDPFETNPRLAELRRNIDERLRRKRCDEAAALLQELAQETGGRIVAELAMNAGDRCQSLGKSNAALNCYLAASRADPVYEAPLSRLADICIDDQDTELAVSYLERVARLHRFRGEDKAALRVYRRIATIAPYREDVLTVLMNAQSTGRFDA